MEVISKSLQKRLNEEIDWRISEISALKTIPYLHSIPEHNKKMLQKYSIPAIYAIWEGFVVIAFQEYISCINRTEITFDNAHPYLLAHDLDMKQGLNNGRVNLNKKVDFCVDLKKYFGQELKFTSKIPTKSNVNFKTINNILERLNLKKFEKHYFEYRLNRLLKYRNDIAHGENSLRVDADIVFELCETVIKCMDQLSDNIIDGFNNRRFLNDCNE